LNVRRVCFLLLVWIAVILMSACSSTLVDSDQPALVSEEQLAEGQALGQSFVAQHGGLAGIELYLRPTSPCHQGKVHLSLKDDPFSGAVLVTSSLPTSAIQAPGFYRFPLDPIGDSHSQYYYASVTTEDDECGAIRVGLAPADTYLNGNRAPTVPCPRVWTPGGIVAVSEHLCPGPFHDSAGARVGRLPGVVSLDRVDRTAPRFRLCSSSCLRWLGFTDVAIQAVAYEAGTQRAWSEDGHI